MSFGEQVAIKMHANWEHLSKILKACMQHHEVESQVEIEMNIIKFKDKWTTKI